MNTTTILNDDINYKKYYKIRSRSNAEYNLSSSKSHKSGGKSGGKSHNKDPFRDKGNKSRKENPFHFIDDWIKWKGQTANTGLIIGGVIIGLIIIVLLISFFRGMNFVDRHPEVIAQAAQAAKFAAI